MEDAMHTEKSPIQVHPVQFLNALGPWQGRGEKQLPLGSGGKHR